MSFNNELVDDDLDWVGTEEHCMENYECYHNLALSYEEGHQKVTAKIDKALSTARFDAEVLDAYEDDPNSPKCKGLNIEKIRKEFKDALAILDRD